MCIDRNIYVSISADYMVTLVNGMQGNVGYGCYNIEWPRHVRNFEFAKDIIESAADENAEKNKNKN